MKQFLLVILTLSLLPLDLAYGIPRSPWKPLVHSHSFTVAIQPTLIRLVLAKTAREAEGVSQASCPLTGHSHLLWGTDQNAGLVTQEIADQLQDQKFSNFGMFRQAFWKAVSRSSHTSEFSPQNQDRMATGRAPIAPESQQLAHQRSYVLHHIVPLHQNGAVYDPCNLMIVTPLFHEEVLPRSYHFAPGRNRLERDDIALDELK